MPVQTESTIGYALSLVCFLAGMALIMGLVHFDAPRPLVASFGAILVLLGINRYFVTRLKTRPRRRRRLLDVDER
jgi:hypothetical protein